MATYLITNDRYSENRDEVTLEELRSMAQENEWEVEFHVTTEGEVKDNRGEVVAVGISYLVDVFGSMRTERFEYNTYEEAVGKFREVTEVGIKAVLLNRFANQVYYNESDEEYIPESNE